MENQEPQFVGSEHSSFQVRLPQLQGHTLEAELIEYSLTDQIKERFGNILLAGLDLLGSKKFWVAVGGGWATYQQTGDAWVILYAAIAYIAAQGLADFGKH